MDETQLSSSDPLSGYVEPIEIRKIAPSKHSLRFEVGPLDELMASIMDKGLLEPIVIRPVNDNFEVVAGNRRLEACRKLKFKRISCHLVELSDKEAYEVSLTENIQRKTLNPLEEGQAFKAYVEGFGYGGISELARRTGKSQSYVSRRIALFGLPENLKEQVLRRRISTSVMNELLPLDDESRAELAEFITETRDTTRNEVRRLARYMSSSKEMRSQTETVKDSYYEVLQIRAHAIDRVLTRCIAYLKEDMGRFGNAIDTLDARDEQSWVVKETLVFHRQSMSDQVDDLIRLRKRFRS